MVTESGQLDQVDVLADYLTQAEDSSAAIEDLLSQFIDANPNEKLFMEMLDLITDAEDSLQQLRNLLSTMRSRDEAEVPG